MLEREEVLKLAKLSRLEVAEEDIESVKGHLVFGQQLDVSP